MWFDCEVVFACLIFWNTSALSLSTLDAKPVGGPWKLISHTAGHDGISAPDEPNFCYIVLWNSFYVPAAFMALPM